MEAFVCIYEPVADFYFALKSVAADGHKALLTLHSWNSVGQP